MEKAKDATRQFAAGGCAGLVEVCIMHPLDLIKTRFQLQSAADPTRYKGLIDCFRTISKAEGYAGFYKTFSLAGLFCGFTEAIVICPFEVVKVRLQSERSVRLDQQKSTYAMARQIINDGGLGTNGIYRGLSSTLMRHGVWNMVYFGLYHSVKDVWQAPKDPTLNFVYRFSIGLLAGTLASVVNIPFDVVKSRIQAPQPLEGRKYFTCTQSLLLVYKEEGFLALYKGLLPKVMRLGPGGAIMLIVYENVYAFLKENT